MASPLSEVPGKQVSQTGHYEQGQSTAANGPDRAAEALLFLFETWNTKADEFRPCHRDIVKYFCTKKLTILDKLKRFATVLDVNLSEDQQQDADAADVTLIQPRRKKKTDPQRDPPSLNWLFYHEIYYPHLKDTSQNVKYVIGIVSVTDKAAEEIHESLYPYAQLVLLDQNVLPPPPAALFVFTDWDKRHLGLPQCHRTLVQDFCARKAKVGEVLKVYSTILGIEVSDDQKKDAEECGVILIPGQRKSRATPEEDPVHLNWLLNHDVYYPDLKKLPNIRYVVGYSPKTGNAAADIKERVFPEAKLYMINHKHAHDPYQLVSGPSKTTLEEKMLQMAKDSDAMFSIGPGMHSNCENDYRAITREGKLQTMSHIELLPKPRACFFIQKVKLQSELQDHVIVSYGQVHVKTLGKYKSFASAINEAGQSLHNLYACDLKWKLYCIPKESEERASEVDQELAGEDFQSHVYNGCTTEQLVTHLKQSHFCLAIPFDEDYGFHGLEAMAIGLPLLTDDDTQLAKFLKKYFPNEGECCVIRRGKSLKEKIIYIAKNTGTAFKQAEELKDKYTQSDAVMKSYARFAALFLPKKEQNHSSLEIYLKLRELEEGYFTERLRERSSEVIDNESTRREVEGMCQQSFGDVGTGTMRLSSLVIPIHFQQLLNLYRVEGACKSGYFARSMEPILITEAMKKKATVEGIQLELIASYDQKKFEEVESYFMNRDGGGVEPVAVKEYIEEDHINIRRLREMHAFDDAESLSMHVKSEGNTGVGNTGQSKAMDERDESFDQEETKQEQPFVYAADDVPRWETKERTPGDGGSVEAVERSRGLKELVRLRNDQEVATEERPIDANISKVGSTVLCTEGHPEGSAGYFAKIRYSKEAQHKEIQIPIDLEETISDLAKKVLDIRHKFPLIPEDQRLVRKEHAEIQIYEKNSFGSSMNFLDKQTKLSTVNYKMLEFDIRTGPSRHSELKDDITRNVCGQNIALFGYDGSGKSSLINTFYRALKGQYVQVAQVFPKGGFERGTRVYANCSFKFGDKTLSWNEVPGLTFRNVVGHRSRKLSEHVLSGKAKRNKPVRLPRVPSFRRPRSHEKIHAIVYVHDSTKDTHAEGIQATLGRVRVLPKYGQGIPMFIILTHTDLPVHETLEENLSAFCEDSGINSGNVFRVPYYDQEQERKGDDGGYERDVEVLSILKTIVTEAKIYKERGGADVVST